MDRAKSLVFLKYALCFLLVIASSLAASCKFSVCYRGCRALGFSKETCAKKCHCSLTNELATKEVGVEEEPSLNYKLMAPCKFSICYRGCRAVGGSKESCAKKCHCSLPGCVPNELGQAEALATAEMEVDYNRAEAVLEEMMMEELISLNDKLTGKCKYNPCYRACRAAGGSKEFCAKKCHCTQVTDALSASVDVKDVDDEL